MRTMQMTILMSRHTPVSWTLSEYATAEYILGHGRRDHSDLVPWELHVEDGSCRATVVCRETAELRTAVRVEVETDVHVVQTVWVAVDAFEMVLGASTNYGHLAVDMVPYAEGGRLHGIYNLQEAE